MAKFGEDELPERVANQTALPPLSQALFVTLPPDRPNKDLLPTSQATERAAVSSDLRRLHLESPSSCTSPPSELDSGSAESSSTTATSFSSSDLGLRQPSISGYGSSAEEIESDDGEISGPWAWSSTADLLYFDRLQAPSSMRCAIVYCYIDYQEIMECFPAPVQVQWWDMVHRLVELVKGEEQLCLACSGRHGFVIVAGVDCDDPPSNARRAMHCALKLLVTLRQVVLPSGDAASVRLGVHFGEAADGGVGPMPIMYLMTGVAIETAKWLALHAHNWDVLVSGDIVHLLAENNSLAATQFEWMSPVKLTESSPYLHVASFQGNQLPQEAEGSAAILEKLRILAAPQRPQAAVQQRDGVGHQSIGNAPQPQAERREWQRLRFRALYERKMQSVCCFANVLVLVAALASRFTTRPAAQAGLSSAAIFAAAPTFLAVFARLLSNVPFATVRGLARRSQSCIRVARVALLLSTVHGPWKQCHLLSERSLQGFVTLTIPLVTINLLDDTLRPTHVADSLCVVIGLATATLLFAWSTTDILALLLFILQVLLGVVVPSIVMRGFQEAACEDFSTCALWVLCGQKELEHGIQQRAARN